MSDLPVMEIIPESYPAFRWEIYSEEHRVLLTSHAFFLEETWWVFDPISIPKNALESWIAKQFGSDLLKANWNILLTNGNHERSVASWTKDRGQCAIHVTSGSELESIAQNIWDPKTKRETADLGPWKRIRLEGGAPGETAYYLEKSKAVVVGDALVNLPDRGFEILPDKYCENPALLRASLGKLTALDLEKLWTAHGKSINTGAGVALSRLLSL
jgi:hypothetical protein